MAPTTSTLLILTLLANSPSCFPPFTLARNPDSTGPFPWPQNTTGIDSGFFTYTAGRSLVGAPPPTQLNTNQANRNTFPALAKMCVSLEVMRFPCGVVNPPHSHPRSSELLLLLSGALQVGFIDLENKLYNQTLQAGDMFVFPKGLIHYHYNFQPTNPSIAITAFASADPGLVSIPSNLFAAGVDDGILALSFKTDIPTIEKLKASVSAAGNGTTA